MIEIRLHDHAKQDIIEHFDDRTKGWLKTLFDEMSCPSLLDSLTTHNDHFDFGNQVINVQEWREQFRGQGRERRNLWRLKPLEAIDGKPLPFRIIYAYMPPKGSFPAEIWILGVFPRNWKADNFQYEKSNGLAQRVMSDYDNLD